MLELYHNETSTSSQKVRLVLAEKRLDWESHHLDLWKGDQHAASYLALNPRGVVPTLVDDGTVIVESTVIMEYLDDAYPTIPCGRLPPQSGLGCDGGAGNSMKAFTLRPAR